MPLSRLIFAVLLTLTLTGAPVLRAFATAPQGPEAASSHPAHCSQAQHAATRTSLPGDVGHAHGGAHPCDGMCCTTCTFGAAAVMLPATAAALLARSIQTPTEPRLSSFSPVSPRDRPPRVLAL
jgi:Protein of unknown function (DUF2946)